jgi:hypothetical protein
MSFLEFSSSLFFEELGNLFFNPSKGISEGNLRLTQEEENVIKSYEVSPYFVAILMFF